MKKFSKILCAVLCLALMCTSLAFIVSANDTPDTVTKTTSAGDLKAVDLANGVEGNMLADAGFSFYQYNQRTDPDGNGKYNDGAEITDKSQLDAFTVYENGSDDGYAVFTAGQFMDGTSQWNIQHTATVSNEKLVKLTNDSYYVVDLDMATASEMIEGLSLSLCNRDASGAGFPFGNVKFSNFVELTNEWIHFTAVGSIKTNTIYVFVNGKYIGTSDYAANPSVLGSNTAEEYGLHAQGIKIEVPYDDGNPAKYNIFKGQSTAFDNLSRRNFTDAESIAALDAIIGSETKDLTQWAGYLTNVRTGKLPAYVEIDGVQYENLLEASKVLKGKVAKTVNVLESFPGGLYVSCDATVNMNGCTGNIYAIDGSTVTEADGVVTVDAPYQPSSVATNISSESTLMAAINVDDDDNSLNSWLLVNMNGISADKVTPGLYSYVVKDNTTDNTYVTVLGNSQINNNCNTYFEIKAMTDVSYNGGAAQYIVYDIDFAMIVNETFPLMIIPRNAGGSGMWGGTSPALNTIAKAGEGNFQHLTVVIDVANNAAYYYNNNTLVHSNTTTGITSVSNFEAFKTAEKWNINSIRLGSNATGSVALDNAMARHITGDAAEALKEVAGQNSLNAWEDSVYSADYVLPTLAPIAYVNGEAVYTDEQLQTKLDTRAELSVDIVANTTAEFVVSAKATVNTNGLAFNGTVAEGGTQSTEGNVITFVGPFVVSGTHTLIDSSATVANFFSPLQASGSLNLATSWSPAKTNHVNIYHSVDNNTGNTYMTFQPKEGTTAYQDIQIGESLSSYIKLGTSDYFVIDADFATENEIPTNFYITSQIYPANGTSAWPFPTSFHPAGFIPEDGLWHHLTLVGDVAENRLWVFIDGVLIDDDRTKSYVAYQATDEQLAAWGGLELRSIKMSNDVTNQVKWTPDQSVAVDSLSLRHYTDGTELEKAIAAGSILGWSENQTGNGGALPEVAVIDGVKYSSVKTAAEALNVQTETAHEVELQKQAFAEIVTNSSANVTTHGFTGFVANAQPEKIGDMLFASNFYVEGDSYVRINSNNYAGLSVGALWYASDWMTSETIYYPFGTQISYVGEMFELKQNVIEDGMIFDEYWADYLGTKIEEFPVAEQNGSYMYVISGDSTATEITVQGGLKYNLSLYANFDMNLYVPVSTGVIGDDKVTIDGVEYVRLTETVPATTMDGNAIFYVDFVVDGVTYSEKVTVNLLTYSQAVLESATVSHQMKRVIVAALDYVNEAQLLLNGAKIPGITNLLASPAVTEYLVEDYTEFGDVNTDALKDVIAGAQLKLDGKVAFVLNVASGFEGDITVAYNDYKGSEITKTYTVKGGESIVLEMKVYNLESVLNITAGEVSGTYSLGGYIKGLVEAGTDAEFAQSLFTYAKVAKDYKLALKAAQ